jgi:hypothetical protein
MGQQKQKFVATSAESKNTGKRKAKVVGRIYGLGYNSGGRYKTRDGSKLTKAYVKWMNMLKRCYHEPEIERRPSYRGCSVCDEWHDYQCFAGWFDKNYPRDGGNYEIDKDLISAPNKTYSPSRCIFVTRKVNSFTTDNFRARGMYMIGASMYKPYGKFVSKCCNPVTGKMEHLGYFETEIEAHLAWRKRKSELAYELAMIQDRDEVKQALLNWKEALDSNIIHPY